LDIKIRPTGMLIENDRILLIKQNVTENRKWSLLGGALEINENIEQCLIRELKEETGLDVILKGLLYVTDRFDQNIHVVHMTFLIERMNKEPILLSWKHFDEHISDSLENVREIRMVPVDELTSYGFPPNFVWLIKTGFPGRGYKGDFEKFYGGL